VTFGWKGAVDTDIQFTEFYPNNHTLLMWFLPQYPRAYTGPLLSVNGSGNYVVGQGDYNTQGQPHLISRIEGTRQVYLQQAFSAVDWYHLALVRNGNQITLFLNGQRIGTQLTLTNTNIPSGTLRLGRMSPGTAVDGQESQFYGMISEFAVYTRVLADSEILARFTNRTHLTGSEPGLLAGFLLSPATPSGLPMRMLRPIVRSGETALVVGPVNWNASDMMLIPMPKHETMELPFLSGDAWRVSQGFAQPFSHRGYAAFCWDFLKEGGGSAWTDLYPHGTHKAPIYSTVDGEITHVSQIGPSINPSEPEQDNMIWVKNATDGFIRTHLHLLKNSARVTVGQKVKRGQPLSQAMEEFMPPRPTPHHHFGIVPDRNDEIGQVTIPAAFSNYEVKQPNGSWAFVSKGIPQHNEVVRRTGNMLGWDHIDSANNVVAMAAYKGKLFAATSANELLWRDSVNTSVNWVHIGHAINVVAMAASNNKLFAATSDNKLWWRDPVEDPAIGPLNWIHIGDAKNVVAMTASNNKLFASTSDNQLCLRDPVADPLVPRYSTPGSAGEGWYNIGHANQVVAMAFWATLHKGGSYDCEGYGKLFAATSDNKLWWRVPEETNLEWMHIGHAIKFVAMTASNSKLFAVSDDFKLWCRDA
jgi:hypothetical protein